MTNQYPRELLDLLQADILDRYNHPDFWNDDIIENFIAEHPADFCPDCHTPLEARAFDIDGTNLVEHKICAECGYGTPALL